MKNFDRILRYIQEEMSKEEHQTFEQELAHDKALQEELAQMQHNLQLLSLEAYADGKLSEKEQKVMEHQITNNPTLQKYLEDYRHTERFLNAAGMVAVTNLHPEEETIIRQSIDTIARSTPSRGRYIRLIAIAASIFLFVSIGILYVIYNQYNTQKVIANVFIPHKAPEQRRGIGTTPNTTVFSQGLEAYNKNDYLIAIAQFNEISEPADSIHMYLGNAYLGLGYYAEAIEAFEEESLAESEFPDEAIQWYSALSYLGIDDEGKSRILLENIIQNQDADKYYKRRAAAVLKKLNSPWRKVFK